MQSGLKIEVSTTALQVISSAIHSSNLQLETGGALFGPPDGSRVLHATVAGPEAEHGPRFFRRDLAFTQRESNRLYQTDGSQWIGEWHTHIDLPPAPSDADLHTYVRHLADRDLGFSRFIALIIAVSGPELTLAAWLLEQQHGAVTLTLAGEASLDPRA